MYRGKCAEPETCILVSMVNKCYSISCIYIAYTDRGIASLTVQHYAWICAMWSPTELVAWPYSLMGHSHLWIEKVGQRLLLFIGNETWLCSFATQHPVLSLNDSKSTQLHHRGKSRKAWLHANIPLTQCNQRPETEAQTCLLLQCATVL